MIEYTRVEQLLNLYTWLRTKYPDRSIVVFSTYLKFLDILFYTLKNQHSIAALRFDGTMSLSSREVVRARFNLSSPEIPLLLTAGAGGVGLNITKASIVIQTEIWWNHNFELQAYAVRTVTVNKRMSWSTVLKRWTALLTLKWSWFTQTRLASISSL